MSSRRLKLNDILVDILGTGGLPTNKQRVYFQPPDTTRIEYPCIIYRRDQQHSIYADNLIHQRHQRYLVTYIDPDPDSTTHLKIADLPSSKHSASFTTQNLNHDSYTVYY